MVDAAVEITGCDRERLLDDFRHVHQRYKDAEHPFALLETHSIKEMYSALDQHEVIRRLDPALHAFNSSRKRTLKLHEGVRETLAKLKAGGVTIIAHTESKVFGVVDRLERLSLFPYFTKVYCRERSVSPHPVPEVGHEWQKRVPENLIVELSHHQRKPDPTVLLEICSQEGFSAQHTAYVGDSIARDILMAKRAGVFAIWAAYGAHIDPDVYAKLVRISHWTDDEVQAELRLKNEARSIKPDFTAEKSFSEILDAIRLPV